MTRASRAPAFGLSRSSRASAPNPRMHRPRTKVTTRRRRSSCPRCVARLLRALERPRCRPRSRTTARRSRPTITLRSSRRPGRRWPTSTRCTNGARGSASRLCCTQDCWSTRAPAPRAHRVRLARRAATPSTCSVTARAARPEWSGAAIYADASGRSYRSTRERARTGARVRCRDVRGSSSGSCRRRRRRVTRDTHRRPGFSSSSKCAWAVRTDRDRPIPLALRWPCAAV